MHLQTVELAMVICIYRLHSKQVYAFTDIIEKSDFIHLQTAQLADFIHLEPAQKAGFIHLQIAQ